MPLEVTYDGHLIDRPRRSPRGGRANEVVDNPESRTRGVLTVIEWNPPVDRTSSYATQGVALWSMAPGVQAPGYRLHGSPSVAQVRAGSTREDFEIIELDVALRSVHHCGRARFPRPLQAPELDEKAREPRRSLEAREVYPYKTEGKTPIEQAEREGLRDVLALEVNSSLPNFGELDRKNRKLAFRLLRPEGIPGLNPEHCSRSSGRVLDLPIAKQNELALLVRAAARAAIERNNGRRDSLWPLAM